MSTLGRVAIVAVLWALCVLAAASFVRSGHAHERAALDERFDSRSETGASFVGAYVDDIFENGSRLASRLINDLDEPEEFARTTALVGSPAAVLLDRQGRVVAVAPTSADLVGQQLADDYAHLSSALAGRRAVSDVVPSAVSGEPIVAFALPLAGRRYGVFSAGYSLEDSPLRMFLERQPIAGTRGYILDSTGAPIVSAGDGVTPAVNGLDVAAALEGPLVEDGRLLAASPVPGTPWTYVLDAPVDAVYAPLDASRRGDWALLVVLALVSLFATVAAAVALGSRAQVRREKAELDHRLRLTVQNAPIGMTMVGLDHRFIEPNLRLCDMLGYSAEELSELTFEDVTHPADVDLDLALLDRLTTGEIDHYELEKRYVQRDATLLLGRLSVTVVRDDRGEALYFVSQIEDVTDLSAARSQLEHRALYDDLTGLANRSLLTDRLAQALDDLADDGHVALAFCDIDYFKRLNDTHGHHGGDAVLVEVGRRLQAAVRDGDTVARMGGDEFTILMPHVTTADEAALVAACVMVALETSFEVDGRSVSVTMSVGLATAERGQAPETLLRNADVALYSAKENGRARLEVYDPARRDNKLAQPRPGDEPLLAGAGTAQP